MLLGDGPSHPISPPWFATDKHDVDGVCIHDSSPRSSLCHWYLDLFAFDRRQDKCNKARLGSCQSELRSRGGWSPWNPMSRRLYPRRVSLSRAAYLGQIYSSVVLCCSTAFLQRLRIMHYKVFHGGEWALVRAGGTAARTGVGSYRKVHCLEVMASFNNL